MSNLLNSNDFGLKIYNRFPPKYREDDVRENLALQRYLQSAGEGGFKFVIEEVNGLTDLINPDKIKAEHLPVLFEHYGMEVFNGIPEQYLRYLLPKLGEIYSMKGSLNSVDYVCTSLSGIKTLTDVSYDDFGNPLVTVKLEMDFNIGDFVPETTQLHRILEKFIPFYCDLLIVYSYLFYETGNLSVSDKHFMNIIDTKNEKSYIIFGQGERYFPMITESTSTKVLNSTFMTNQKVTYSLDTDYCEEVVTNRVQEIGKFSSKKSYEHLRPNTNEDTKTLNDDFTLNDGIDTDESYDTIKLVQKETGGIKQGEYRREVITLGNVYFYPVLNTSLVLNKDLLTNNDQSDILNLHCEEHEVDHLVTTYNEVGVIDSSKSHLYLAEMLNRDSVRTNDTFMTNEHIDTDEVTQQSLGNYEVSAVSSEDKERVNLQVDKFSFFASLNTTMVTNSTFMTNETHSDVGFTLGRDSRQDSVMTSNSDISKVSSYECEQVGMFLNFSISALNKAVLSSLSSYDKITKSGKVSYHYPTPYGYISA